ncbi:MAG: sialidase family protein [bacterium]
MVARGIAIALLVLLAAGCSGPAAKPSSVLLDESSTSTTAPPDPRIPTQEPTQPQPTPTTSSSSSNEPTSTTTTSTQPTGLPPAPVYPGFPDAVTPITQSGSLHETSLAIAPDGQTLLSCDAQDHGTNGGVPAGYHVSNDAGKTWKNVLEPPAAADPRSLMASRGNDCDVAVDAAGTLYAADAWQDGVAISRSTDGGATWTLAQSLAGVDPAAAAASGGTTVYERPWLAAGATGHVDLVVRTYVPFVRSDVLFARSTDSGSTFTTPVMVATGSVVAGAPAVSPDGSHIWVPYHEFSSAASLMRVAASTDGGKTWTPSTATSPGQASSKFPSLGIDAGGGLHLVDAQMVGAVSKVVYWHSTDAGTSWTAPAILSGPVAALSPWVAGGKGGQAAVAWFGAYAGAAHPTDRYLFWARITADGVQSATTTTAPVYSGSQPAPPEFGVIRLDAAGHMRFGYSVPAGTTTGWQSVYQAQSAGPAT